MSLNGMKIFPQSWANSMRRVGPYRLAAHSGLSLKNGLGCSPCLVIHSTALLRYLRFHENRTIARQVLKDKGLAKVKLGIEGFPTYANKIKSGPTGEKLEGGSGVTSSGASPVWKPPLTHGLVSRQLSITMSSDPSFGRAGSVKRQSPVTWTFRSCVVARRRQIPSRPCECARVRGCVELCDSQRHAPRVNMGWWATREFVRLHGMTARLC